MGACCSKPIRFSYDMNKTDTVAAQDDTSSYSPGNRADGVGPVSHQNIASTPTPSESESREVEEKEAVYNKERGPELLNCNTKVTEDEGRQSGETAVVTDAGNSSDRGLIQVQDGGESSGKGESIKTKSSKDDKVLEGKLHAARIGDDIKEISAQHSLKQSCSEQQDCQGSSQKIDSTSNPGHVEEAEKTSYSHAKKAASDAEYHRLSLMSDDDISETVQKCWADIERGCGPKRGTKGPVSNKSPTGWRVVRLFVSSTFADYHAEREVLVKKVSEYLYVLFYAPIKVNPQEGRKGGGEVAGECGDFDNNFQVTPCIPSYYSREGKFS